MIHLQLRRLTGNKISAIENLGATEASPLGLHGRHGHGLCISCNSIVTVPVNCTECYNGGNYCEGHYQCGFFAHPIPCCIDSLQNQFDSIDLSDNAIVKLEGFPRLHRLKQLLLNNNRIARINKTCHGASCRSAVRLLCCLCLLLRPHTPPACMPCPASF